MSVVYERHLHHVSHSRARHSSMLSEQQLSALRRPTLTMADASIAQLHCGWIPEQYAARCLANVTHLPATIVCDMSIPT